MMQNFFMSKNLFLAAETSAQKAFKDKFSQRTRWLDTDGYFRGFNFFLLLLLFAILYIKDMRRFHQLQRNRLRAANNYKSAKLHDLISLPSLIFF